MKKFRVCLWIILFALGLVGCQESSNPTALPTGIPFPTVTAGFSVHGVLSPDQAQRPGDPAVFSPATIIAQSNQPTPTPDLSACPPLTNTREIAESVDNSDQILSEITRFLSAGGSPQRLENVMRESWGIMGDNSEDSDTALGFIRTDLDLTGEGQPEIVFGYSPPDEGGTLLIVGCENRQYIILYRSVSDAIDAPRLILIGDMNRDFLNDLMFTIETCEFGIADSCTFLTQLVSWEPSAGRFVSLLGARIISDEEPTLTDFDNDEVTEIVARLTNNGTAITGPLRTGTNIYDWNGTVYVLSIQELDPPEFRIQIIHEADRLLRMGNIPLAVQLYQQTLAEESELRLWRDDEEDLLTSYALLKLLIARSTDSPEDSLLIYERIVTTFPDPAQTTVYIQLTQLYWDALQVTGSVQEACAEVRTFVGQNTSAVDLMNRYGNRSPIYTPMDICPF